MAGAIKKADSRQTRQQVSITDIQSIDITANGTYYVELSVVAEKISFQATGTVAGTIEFSLTGVDYKNSTAIAATQGIVTYSTSLAKKLKITTTGGGTGRLVIAGK